MTACSLAGIIGVLLGLIIGTERVPPNAGFEGPAILFVWFTGLGFSLALLAGIFGWMMREEFLGRAIRYLIVGLVVMALAFAGWLYWRRSHIQTEPQPPPPGVSIRTTSPA